MRLGFSSQFLTVCGLWFLTSIAWGEITSPTASKDPMAVGNALYEKGDYGAAAEQYRQAARGNAPASNVPLRGSTWEIAMSKPMLTTKP